MSTIQKPRNSQIQYKFYINSTQIMILDPEYTEEELDAKYDTLLSEYTKLKEQINSLKSEKQIQGETEKYANSIKNIASPQKPTNNNNEITENIKSQLSEIINRFALENQELQSKVADKRGKLEEKTKTFNQQRQAQINALQAQKDQESKQINRIKSEIAKLTNDINGARLQQDKVKQKGAQAASSQEKNKQAENNLRNIIGDLKKQVAESEKKIKELKNQIENGNKDLKNPSKNQKKPEDLKKSLDNATQQIAKKRKDLQQTEKSILVEKEVQTKAQTNKEIYNKEADLRKRLESNKSEGEKLKKLIATHEQNKKKYQQKKVNPKKPDQSNNELNKLINQNRFHQNGIKWQEKKLNDFIEVKKKYVNKKELQALNEKKIQYQNLNKNFNTSAAEYKAVEKKLKEVQDVINKINKENSRVITDKETQLSQLKGRTAELSKKKEQVDKNLTELKNKLELYKKEYPNFERESKQDEQILSNIKNALKQKMNAEKAEKKQRLSKKEKKKEQTDQQYLQKMLPKSTSEAGFGETILANPTYKYSAIGAAVALLLGVYYSL